MRRISGNSLRRKRSRERHKRRREDQGNEREPLRPETFRARRGRVATTRRPRGRSAIAASGRAALMTCGDGTRRLFRARRSHRRGCTARGWELPTRLSVRRVRVQRIRATPLAHRRLRWVNQHSTPNASTLSALDSAQHREGRRRSHSQLSSPPRRVLARVFARSWRRGLRNGR